MKTQQKPLKVTVRRKKVFSAKDGKPVLGAPQEPAQEQKKPYKFPPKVKESMAMLKKRWPSLFDIKNPKPLKIGIFTEIREKEKLETNERKEVALAIRRYCNSLAYQKAMIRNSHRYDLEGNKAEKVEDSHRRFAEHKIKNIEKKISMFRKGKKTISYDKKPV